MKHLSLTKTLLLSSALIAGGTVITFAPAWSSDLVAELAPKPSAPTLAPEQIGVEKDQLKSVVASSTADAAAATSEEAQAKKKIQKPNYLLGLIPWGTKEIEEEIKADDQTPAAPATATEPTTEQKVEENEPTAAPSLTTASPQPTPESTDTPTTDEATPAPAASSEPTADAKEEGTATPPATVVEVLPEPKAEAAPVPTGWFSFLSWGKKTASTTPSTPPAASADNPTAETSTEVAATSTEPATTASTQEIPSTDAPLVTAPEENLETTASDKSVDNSTATQKDLSSLTIEQLQEYVALKKQRAKKQGKSLADIRVGDSLFLTKRIVEENTAASELVAEETLPENFKLGGVNYTEEVTLQPAPAPLTYSPDFADSNTGEMPEKLEKETALTAKSQFRGTILGGPTPSVPNSPVKKGRKPIRTKTLLTSAGTVTVQKGAGKK